jgi:hypothetical protein
MKQMKMNPPTKVIPENKKKVPGTPRPDISELVQVDINRTQDQMAKLDSEKPDSVNITMDT